MPILQKEARSQAGFTLSEVLLVATLIAALLALLLPFGGRLSQQSRRVKCAGNLRQIAALMQLYLGDHQYRFPPGGIEVRNDAGKVQRKFWGEFLTEHSGLKDLRCFICPSVSKEEIIPGLLKNQTGFNMAYVSYGINRYGIAPSLTDGTRAPAVLSKIPEPSKMLLLVDHEDKGQPNDGWYLVDHSNADKTFANVSKRHSGTLNVLYCDGHVETGVTKEKLLGKSRSDYPWAQEHYLGKK